MNYNVNEKKTKNVTILGVNKNKWKLIKWMDWAKIECSIMLQISHLIDQVSNDAITQDGIGWLNVYLVKFETIVSCISHVS